MVFLSVRQEYHRVSVCVTEEYHGIPFCVAVVLCVPFCETEECIRFCET